MGEPVLHLSGHVLVSPDDEVAEAWVIGGRLTFERPSHATDVVELADGWVIPGLVDAHCHIGLDPHEVTASAELTEDQARADLAGGTMLIRDAGSPVDTRWIDERDDLPRIIRAGRHIARPRRYIRNFADEVEP